MKKKIESQSTYVVRTGFLVKFGRIAFPDALGVHSENVLESRPYYSLKRVPISETFVFLLWPLQNNIQKLTYPKPAHIVCGTWFDSVILVEHTRTWQLYRNSPECRSRHFSEKLRTIYWDYRNKWTIPLTIIRVIVFPIIWLNRSCACTPRTIKNSVPNRYSRQALSTKAYCSDRNSASYEYWK